MIPQAFRSCREPQKKNFDEQKIFRVDSLRCRHSGVEFHGLI